jgi:acyl-coenzyme A synthetase/AMP-(fatty) acid ligase
LKAFVVSDREGSELARELRSLSRGRLATFKVPQSFEVVSELPRTASGKVRRFVLREDTVAGPVRS